MFPLAERITAQEAKAIAASFRSPPVSEVSLAVAFQPVALGVVAASELWRKAFKDAYPTVDEQGLVRMPVERFDGVPSAIPPLQFELSDATTALPRLWFVSSDGSALIQLQRDWFARNWRRTEASSAAYPLYPAAREAFERDLRRVVKAVGALRPLQAEITYINQIEDPDMAAVLTSRSRTAGDQPEFEGYTSQYVLTRDGVAVARLYLQAQKAVRRTSGEGLTVLTITVRGAPIGEGIDGVLKLFDLGSEEALVAFIQATRPALHKKWSSG